MKRYYGKNTRPRFQPTYYLIVNSAASGYSKSKIDYLIEEIAGAGGSHHLLEPSSPRDTAVQIRRIIHRRPEGIIACGGDSTVNAVAQHLIRRTSSLGILPLGRFNNIYRSLYGEPDIKKATRHILSHRNRQIDHGLASGHFFLGSIAWGFIPELLELIDKKGMPRFGISWSRYASLAAAQVKSSQFSIKIDAFKFDLAPRMLNINLLPFSLGLQLTAASIDDDGKGEIVFDIGQAGAIFSSYLRQIFKKKYIYSDDIRMFRGSKISISPMKGNRLLFDGEIIDYSAPSLEVEIFEKKIRVFHQPEE
jgi:diacylglycerol kinase family enzyme